MKSSIILVATAFLCLVAFPTTTIGKNLRGWPNPSEISRNEMFMNNAHKLNYGDSKVWKCTYSNGSAPAISISPSIPSTPSPSTPSTPSPSTPSTPTPSTPSPSTPPSSPPTPKTSPPPPTPPPPPPTPKKSPPPPTPSLPPPTPKKSPSPPTPTPSPSTPSTPSLPPPTPKKSPSPPPSNPPPEHHHSHHRRQNPWEHIDSCMRNMGHVAQCRMQMEFSFYTRMFHVSDYCCNLIVNMRNECDDVIWGFFTDPFFVPLVRFTCHVTY